MDESPQAAGAMLNAQRDMFLSGLGQISRDMIYFGKNAASVGEVSHETGKSFVVYYSTDLLGNRRQIRTDTLPQYTFLPSESFFRLRFKLTDSNATPAAVNASTKTFTPLTGGETALLESCFNGVDSIVENIQIRLNGQAVNLMTSTLYQREARFIKYVYCTKAHEKLHTLDGSFLRTNDDGMDDKNIQITTLKTVGKTGAAVTAA